MSAPQTFYLSRVLGNKIYTCNNKKIGRIKDFVVDTSSERPKIIAVKIKYRRKLKYLDFKQWQFIKSKGQYRVKCNEVAEIHQPEGHTLHLVKHILDKQIVDTNGRKLVRVNDLRIAVVSTGAFVVAVDVGLEGLFRRIGIAKPVKFILKPFGLTLPGKFVLWDEVETIHHPKLDIQLSKPQSKLNLLHPSDLADIIEDLDRKTKMALFTTMDEERAADVLEEMEPDEQVEIIENLPLYKAADLLEKMPPDEAADLLEELKEDKAEEILKEMESEVSDEVRELMEYEEKEVGSLMSTDFLYFHENDTIAEVILELRESKPEVIYSLFVFDRRNRLQGTVSIRDVLVSPPELKLAEIMNKSYRYVYDDDKTKSLAEIISKYNLLAVPVVDHEMKMLGTVIIDDVLDHLMN